VQNVCISGEAIESVFDVFGAGNQVLFMMRVGFRVLA
jgi:hypothetical protein